MLDRVANFAWLLLGGCSQDEVKAALPTWDDAAAVCPLTAPDGGAPVAGYSTMQPVSAECAVWIGLTFQMDWESFAEEPRAFTQPISPAERTIAGLLVAFGTSGVTVGEVLAEGAPAQLDDELTVYAVENSLDLEDEAGRLWFAFLRGEITQIRYWERLDAVMSYRGGTVSVGDIAGLATDPDGGFSFGGPELSAERVAKTLIHEAAHGVYPGHIDCVDETGAVVQAGACDATADGAHGGGLWWLWLWLSKTGMRLSESDCRDTWYQQMATCSQVTDSGDFPPCSFEENPCEQP